jgi:protocatechuate 3,4-dioxygenase beta subunit
MKPGYEALPTDPQGRFRVAGVIPGFPLTLNVVRRAQIQTIALGLEEWLGLRPGETKDLGDITVKLGEGNAEPPQEKNEEPKGADGANQNKPPTANGEASDLITYRGRVLDPEGQPVAGARLYLSGPATVKPNPAVRATTGADGRYHFTVRSADVTDPKTGQLWFAHLFVAAAEGYGPDWVAMRKQPEGELTFHLVRPGEPIKGRVLDLQGKPLRGIAIQVHGIETLPQEDLAPYLQAWEAGTLGPGVEMKALYQPWSNGLPRHAATTDSDGRFTLQPDAGRQRMVLLSVQGPDIANGTVRVVPRPPDEIKRLMSKGTRPNSPTLYAPTFDYVAEPTRVVLGTVREQGTGKPLAGVTVSGYAEGYLWYNSAEVVTDAQGRYRLTGLPSSKVYQHFHVGASPAEGSSFLQVDKRVKNGDGQGPLQVDFELVRGVPVKGRVTDQVTGKPPPACQVFYSPLSGNPDARTAPGVAAYAETDRDGRFTFLSLPGPGILLARVRDNPEKNIYVQARFTPEDRKKTFYSSIQGDDAVATASRGIELLHIYNAYHVIDPPPNAAAVTADIVFVPGKEVTGTVVDPAGTPLKGALVYGLSNYWHEEARTLDSSRFTAIGLDPRCQRKLLFAHPGRKLAGHLYLRGDEAIPPVVKLEPWGTVTGRLTDADGNPRKGAGVDLTYERKDGGVYHARFDSVSWMKSPLEATQTDQDGRFCVEGVIPGLKVGMNIFAEKRYQRWATLGPGETKDLGDIPMVP